VRFSHFEFIRAVIAHAWPKRERLSCIAVASALASHAGIGTGNNCWPSTETLAGESGVSRPTVIRARRALREAGFLTWSKRAGRAHGFTYQLTVPIVPTSGGETEALRMSARGQADTPRNGVGVKRTHRTRSNGDTASRSNGSTGTGTGELEQRTGGERAHAREDPPPPLRKSLEDEDLPEDTWIALLAQHADECAVPGVKSKDFVVQARETLRRGVDRLSIVKALEAERDSGAPAVYYAVFDRLKETARAATQLDPEVVTPERLNSQLGRPLSNLSLSTDELDELAASIGNRGLKMRDVSNAVSDVVAHAPGAPRSHQLGLLAESLGLRARPLAHVREPPNAGDG
jgi:hypothetical protein